MVKRERKQKGLIYKLFILIVLLATSVALLIPTLKNLNFGLDLKGGFEVLYQVESLDGSEVNSSMLSSTFKTISKRIDVLGVLDGDIDMFIEAYLRS